MNPPSLISFLLLAGSLVSTALQAGDTRVFVNQQGLTLEGEVLGVQAGNVNLLRKADQRPVSVTLASLCQEDRAFLADWARRNGSPTTAAAVPPPATDKKAEPAKAMQPLPPGVKHKLTGTVQTRKSDRLNGGYSDMRTAKFQMDVVIQSREPARELKDAKATFAVITKNVADTSDFQVLLLESFPVNVPPMGKMDHATPEMKLEYDNLSTYRYGYKYQGYVLLVKDAAGQTLVAESSPDDYAKNAERILSLKQGDSIDRQLKQVKRVVR